MRSRPGLPFRPLATASEPPRITLAGGKLFGNQFLGDAGFNTGR